MAQTMLEELLRQYHILTSSTPDVIEIAEELVQESDSIPQGIPALYEYSERVHRERRRAKELLNVFMNVTTRHRGRLLDFRLAPLILVLAYLSIPLISSMLWSVLEGTGRLMKGIATRAHHPRYVTNATQTCGDPSYVTKATQTCTDPSTEEDSEQETVTFSIAEMMWLKSVTTDLLRNHEESKIRQADMLTAIGDLEDENESLRDDVTRLEARVQELKNQHALDQDTQRKLRKEREAFRLGGKDFKEKWEKLQKEYNDLEDDRDEHRVMVEKLQNDLKNMTAQRDNREKANELLKIENEKLKANAGTDQDAALKYEEPSEDLNNQVSQQKRELEAAAKETADLKAQLSAVKEASWEGFNDLKSGLDIEEPKELGFAVQAAGSQFGVKEDTSKPSTQPMNVEQSKVGIWKLKKELDQLDALHRRPEPSRDTSRGAIFEQPQGLSDSNVEEGTPLRRTQSAPLWLPLPRHGDTFDPLYDVSDYGNDDDHNDGADDEDGGEDPGDQDDTHDSGDDNGNGSHQGENDDDDDGDDISGHENSNGAGQDENNDDNDGDDRCDGGAENFVIKAYQTRQDHAGDTTPRPEDTPLPDTPPNGGHIPVTPESSPPQVSPNLDVAAPAFVFTHRPTRPVPFRAMGPEDTKNDHIKKLNEELKRRAWIEKSGKPDMAEGNGVAVAEDVIDDMYDRQITQFLTFDPINCARGSMWGALNDVPNRLDDVSVPTKKEDDAKEASAQTQQNSDAHSSGSQEGNKEHDEADGEWSDIEDEDHEGNDGVMPMLGRYQVTGGPKDGQKDDATPMLGNYKVTRGPEPVVSSAKESPKKPTVDTQKSNQSIAPAHDKSGAPKDGEESEAAGNRTDFEDGTDGEIQDEDSPEENGGMPMLGKNKVTRGDTPSNSDHETSEAEKVSEHDSSPPMTSGTSTEEMSRQDVTTPVPASQSAGPSTSDLATTHQPDVTAVSQAPSQDVTTPVRVSQSAGPSDSGTTNQPDTPTGPQAHTSPNPSPKSSTSDLQTSIQPNNPDTTPTVRVPSPHQSGLENQDTTPIVRLPQQPLPNQTQPAPATPSTPTSTQAELDNNTNPKPATSPHPPQPSSPPSTPTNPGFPPQDRPMPSPSSRHNGVTQDSTHAPPPGPAASTPSRSRRGNARGGRGGRGSANNTHTGNTGRGRGCGSETAADSFQRFQERMAREKRS